MDKLSQALKDSQAERDDLQGKVIQLRGEVAQCLSSLTEYQAQFISRIQKLQSTYSDEAATVGVDLNCFWWLS